MGHVAIIPARGGSKRVPRKNVRPFAGRPMLEWPIGIAAESGLFEHIVVSTDDDEIASVANAAGARVPFRRPLELADDHASSAAVVEHALQWLADEGEQFHFCCCIYPTAAMIAVPDLTGALERLDPPRVRFVLAVQEYAHPVQRALVETSRGLIEPLDESWRHSRTQDLPPAFHDAGQFCWGVADSFRRGEPIMDGHTAPWLLDRWRVVDIDTEDDWTFAETIMNSSQERG